jgi:hypothetical protein
LANMGSICNDVIRMVVIAVRLINNFDKNILSNKMLQI